MSQPAGAKGGSGPPSPEFKRKLKQEREGKIVGNGFGGDGGDPKIIQLDVNTFAIAPLEGDDQDNNNTGLANFYSAKSPNQGTIDFYPPQANIYNQNRRASKPSINKTQYIQASQKLSVSQTKNI